MSSPAHCGGIREDIDSGFQSMDMGPLCQKAASTHHRRASRVSGVRGTRFEGGFLFWDQTFVN